MSCNNIWSLVPSKWKSEASIWSIGGYHVPWGKITDIWSSATQVWSKALVECAIPPGPIPPAPVFVIEDMSGALPQGGLEYEHPWAVAARKHKKKTVELTCVVGEIYFNEKKEVQAEKEQIPSVKTIKFSVKEGRGYTELVVNNLKE